MDIFDVARWSHEDILCKAEELGLTPLSEKEIDIIIEILSDRFDANYGINWDTLESAILLLEREK